MKKKSLNEKKNHSYEFSERNKYVSQILTVRMSYIMLWKQMYNTGYFRNKEQISMFFLCKLNTKETHVAHNSVQGLKYCV